MYAQLSKKFRFLLEISTLYSYIFHRALGKIRTVLKMQPLYPYEDVYRYDEGTEQFLVKLRQNIPDCDRGDNPAFNKRWESVFVREQKAETIGRTITEAVGRPGPVPEEQLRPLADRGYTRLEHKDLRPQQVNDILSYLDRQKVFPSHVAHFTLQRPAARDAVKRGGHPFGSYDLQTILQAPHIAELLSDREVIGLIGNYFGCLPTVSSVNLFWSFAFEKQEAKGPQRFHRDVDDVRTCTMFINLTDTSRDDGAHCYIPRTHTVGAMAEDFPAQKNAALPPDLNPLTHPLRPEDFFTLPLNGYAFDKLYQHFYADRMHYLYGPRGSVVITDNYGIHRGIPPKSRDRLILWVSFALTATHTQSVNVKPQKRPRVEELAGRVEDNPISRYVLRNMINFSTEV